MTSSTNTGFCKTILEAIGETPLVKLNKIPQEAGIKATIYVKAEYLSAGGSAQDRFAKKLIELAESRGILTPGQTVVYACHGNVAISMAMVCAVKGYSKYVLISIHNLKSVKNLDLVTLTLNGKKNINLHEETRLVIGTQVSAERDIDTILTSLGAEVIRTNDGKCALSYLRHLNLPNSVLLNTLEKEVFPEALAFHTAEEIFAALNQVSLVLVPHGQGVTNISSKAPAGTKVVSIRTVANHKGKEGMETYKYLEGDNTNTKDIYSSVAFLTARRLIREEGVMCGPAGGAAVAAALKLAKNLSEGENVVVVLGDGIRNYMNKFIDDEWLKAHGIISDVHKPSVAPKDTWDESLIKSYNPTTLAGCWEKDADGRYTNCSVPFKPFRTARPAILNNMLEALGNTPLVKLNKIPEMNGIKCNMYVKCEYMNAGGSIKDRIANRMIELAEQNGLLKPGMTIIEPTSGNTGIGLSLASAVKGYKCIIVMPRKMSKEKALAMEALGSIIVRTPNEAASDAADSHIGVALRLQKEIPGSIILDQYRNMGNPLAHYEQTAEEILLQMNGKIDAVVVGAGTGGSVTGIGMKIKDRVPTATVIGTDPVGSILADPTQTCTSFYEVEGVGYDFIPGTLKRDVVDKWVKTLDQDSFETSRALIAKEGLLCGGSSGANVWAAIQIAKELPADANVVAVLPDGIRNYLSKFLDDEWLAVRDLSLRQ